MAATLLICLGNRLRGDDALGALAAEALRPALRERGLEVELRSGRYDAMNLTNAWRGRDRVHVIDAVRAGAATGTIHHITVGRDDLGALRHAASTHALGLREAVELSATIGALPASLTIWGICGARFDIDSAISPAVEQALPELIRRVLAAVGANTDA